MAFRDDCANCHQLHGYDEDVQIYRCKNCRLKNCTECGQLHDGACDIFRRQANRPMPTLHPIEKLSSCPLSPTQKEPNPIENSTHQPRKRRPSTSLLQPCQQEDPIEESTLQPRKRRATLYPIERPQIPIESCTTSAQPRKRKANPFPIEIERPQIQPIRQRRATTFEDFQLVPVVPCPRKTKSRRSVKRGKSVAALEVQRIDCELCGRDYSSNYINTHYKTIMHLDNVSKADKQKKIEEAAAAKQKEIEVAAAIAAAEVMEARRREESACLEIKEEPEEDEYLKELRRHQSDETIVGDD